jgi:hypothetical protein
VLLALIFRADQQIVDLAMGGWNNWMQERDTAPLDHIKQIMQTQWSTAKTWFEDACCNDDAPNSNPSHQKGLTAWRRMEEQPKAVICMSGYDELDNATSRSTPSTSASPSPILSPMEEPKTVDHVTSNFSFAPSGGTWQDTISNLHSSHLADNTGNETRNTPEASAHPDHEKDLSDSSKQANNGLANAEVGKKTARVEASKVQVAEKSLTRESESKCVTPEISSTSNETLATKKDFDGKADSTSVEPSSLRENIQQQCGQGLSMLQKGSRVEVWSNSQSVWCQGIVLEFFAVEAREHGYKVPAGTYKVGYGDRIVKWIKPEQVSEFLRIVETPE